MQITDKYLIYLYDQASCNKYKENLFVFLKYIMKLSTNMFYLYLFLNEKVFLKLTNFTLKL